jgi:hypothetical protein
MVTVTEVNDFLDGLRQYRIPLLLKSTTNGKWLKASSRPKDLNADSRFFVNTTTTNAEAVYLDNRTGSDIVNGIGNKLFTLKNFSGQSLREVSPSFPIVSNRKALVFSNDVNTQSLDVTISYKGVDGSGNLIFFFGANNINDIQAVPNAIDNNNVLVDGVGSESVSQVDPLGWSVYLYVIMNPNDPAIDNSIYNGMSRRWANVDATDATVYNIVNDITRKVPIGDKVYLYNGGVGYYNDQTLGALAFIDTYRDFFVNGPSLSNFNELITTNIDLTSDIKGINKSLDEINTKLNTIQDDAKQARGWSTWSGVFAIIQIIFAVLMLLAILIIVIVILVKSSGKLNELKESIAKLVNTPKMANIKEKLSNFNLKERLSKLGKKKTIKGEVEIGSPYNVVNENDGNFSDIFADEGNTSSVEE